MFNFGILRNKRNETTHTFSLDEPSDVSSPSLPSSQGLRLLGFFFLLLLSLSAPCLSASGILPSAAEKRDNRLRVIYSRHINPTPLLKVSTSANLHHPRLVGLRVAAFSYLPLPILEVLSSSPEQLDTNNVCKSTTHSQEKLLCVSQNLTQYQTL